MPETAAVLRFHTSGFPTTERIRFYLDETTRPNFDDEVPKSEINIFKAIEFAEVPVEIDQQGNQVTAWFELIDENDVLNLFRAFDSLSGIADRYAYFSDDEEYRVYWRYEQGSLYTIYTIEDDAVTDEKLWSLDWGEKGLEWIIDTPHTFLV